EPRDPTGESQLIDFSYPVVLADSGQKSLRPKVERLGCGTTLNPNYVSGQLLGLAQCKLRCRRRDLCIPRVRNGSTIPKRPYILRACHPHVRLGLQPAPLLRKADFLDEGDRGRPNRTNRHASI